ncbi:MAG: NADH-quinone oxidoreductase subunit J [Rhodospirillales bacterium]|nr:NADH-quinone oxidoreductase subunit J [Rhodospirillales bacterium]
MIATVGFYVFAVILLASATMVVTARNPVHSVLFLILAFFNAAALFLLAGAEFLALILVIVYVGAVAVLFLFVVMMLDVNFAEMREGLQRYAPVGLVVGLILLSELALVLGGWHFAPGAIELRMVPTPRGLTNTAALGAILYTRYILLFQIAGLILLVAMIGAIVLTLRDRRAVRRQTIAVQNARQPADTVAMVKVPLGAGISEIAVLNRPAPAEADPEAMHGGSHARLHAAERH